MSLGIVVVGASFVDVKGYPFGTYIPAGRNAGRVENVHGGVSRNVAEDIANVELRPTFVSLVDESGLGADVVEKLNRHRCNTSYIRRTPDGLGTWLAVFDHQGDVVASISKRPDMLPLLDIFAEKGDEIISRADAVVLEIDMEAEVLKRVLKLAEKYGRQVFAVVSNMSIAIERRDLMKRVACLVCNEQEAGILFSENYADMRPEELSVHLSEKVRRAGLRQMVVTMGAKGSAWANAVGEHGVCPAMTVQVRDTTGCGDAFFAGIAMGLTYGKTLAESCVIGTRLAASVICTTENVCPRFLPAEFGIRRPQEEKE